MYKWLRAKQLYSYKIKNHTHETNIGWTIYHFPFPFPVAWPPYRYDNFYKIHVIANNLSAPIKIIYSRCIKSCKLCNWNRLLTFHFLYIHAFIGTHWIPFVITVNVYIRIFRFHYAAHRSYTTHAKWFFNCLFMYLHVYTKCIQTYI